jgi:hypothetical protein
VVGASVVVKNLAAVRRTLEQAGLKPATGTSNSILLPPELTHGIWVECRGTR